MSYICTQEGDKYTRKPVITKLWTAGPQWSAGIVSNVPSIHVTVSKVLLLKPVLGFPLLFSNIIVVTNNFELSCIGCLIHGIFVSLDVSSTELEITYFSCGIREIL
jgi:hypothetical protein